MKVLLFIIPFCLLLSVKGKASDSTSLFNERVQKLREFANWLHNNSKKEITNEGVYYQYDSATNKNWKTYDDAIALFYKTRILDSIINDNQNSDVIFSPSTRIKMVKGFISRFAYFSHHIQSDSFNFRHLKTEIDYTPGEAESLEISNIIEQYNIVNGESISYLLFFFENKTSKLLGIAISEPQGLQLEKFKLYVESLKEIK